MKSPNRGTSRFHLLEKPKGCVCARTHVRAYAYMHVSLPQCLALELWSYPLAFCSASPSLSPLAWSPVKM